jgi:hypothetical protein
MVNQGTGQRAAQFFGSMLGMDQAQSQAALMGLAQAGSSNGRRILPRN